MWFRRGSDVVRTWFGCGSDVVRTWFGRVFGRVFGSGSDSLEEVKGKWFPAARMVECFREFLCKSFGQDGKEEGGELSEGFTNLPKKWTGSARNTLLSLSLWTTHANSAVILAPQGIAATFAIFAIAMPIADPRNRAISETSQNNAALRFKGAMESR